AARSDGQRVDLLEMVESRLDPDRLAALTLQLVGIRSYPGEEAEIATAYAELLEEAGAHSELETSVAGSPSVIARAGAPSGPCIQLSGHLDTVPIPPEPPQIVGHRLYGRAACPK